MICMIISLVKKRFLRDYEIRETARAIKEKYDDVIEKLRLRKEKDCG